MKGWFDAFRNDGGPTLYSYSNRTPVTGDVSLITIFVLFGTVFVAFLLIFPGIRKERLTTFLTVTLVVFVGMTINVALLGSTWHTSTATIVSSYSAYSRQRMTAEIGGYIGLMHINITYRVLPESADMGDVEYNERFYWRKPHEMTDCFKDALFRGTPFPIVSLAEYFSLHQEGFSWGGKYREAGYYASVMLWTSFASWSMTGLLLVMVPRYGAYGMVFTGLCMLFTNLTYWSLLPCDPLVAHVDGSILIFNFGWNYWLVLVAGIAFLLAGVVITAIDMIFPHSFSTILEVDYDTPYDRHVIIEESFDTRRKDFRRKMGRIEDSFSDQFMSQVSSKLVNGNKEDHRGMVNRGYVSHPSDLQEDSSKGNWSYPFPSTQRRVV
ncbi:dual oxidase maturation factor 1 isoform X2 [Nasonia vitripennis]|nr:dual oxidase maturation factor 1 isoform X2 [Nasonia vitripennis]XP_008212793.1 dual oxidase maturation factor 1 isoform X2 [Nasonia vitripennis]XP_016838605.1 dual oxidase maturation factor 1 isoform X2 [Nasonia vitripennis]XP_016838606.1 dual oxidase maturation factor 1 isoform X2 [Nasonia vitripennis]